MLPLLSPDYEKYKAKVTSLCYVYREVTAKMFFRSDAYKFKVDAEIGEDSGKRQKKNWWTGACVSWESNQGI